MAGREIGVTAISVGTHYSDLNLTGSGTRVSPV